MNEKKIMWFDSPKKNSSFSLRGYFSRLNILIKRSKGGDRDCCRWKGIKILLPAMPKDDKGIINYRSFVLLNGEFKTHSYLRKCSEVSQREQDNECFNIIHSMQISLTVTAQHDKTRIG